MGLLLLRSRRLRESQRNDKGYLPAQDHRLGPNGQQVQNVPLCLPSAPKLPPLAMSPTRQLPPPTRLSPHQFILIASLALLVTLPACHSPKPFAPSLWFYRSYESSATSWDSLVSRFSYLDLQADSTFTQDFGHFYYGKWK